MSYHSIRVVMSGRHRELLAHNAMFNVFVLNYYAILTNLLSKWYVIVTTALLTAEKLRFNMCLQTSVYTQVSTHVHANASAHVSARTLCAHNLSTYVCTPLCAHWMVAAVVITHLFGRRDIRYSDMCVITYYSSHEVSWVVGESQSPWRDPILVMMMF